MLRVEINASGRYQIPMKFRIIKINFWSVRFQLFNLESGVLKSHSLMFGMTSARVAGGHASLGHRRGLPEDSYSYIKIYSYEQKKGNKRKHQIRLVTDLN